METRKIPNHLENPFDDFLIGLAEYYTPLYKKYGFNPNMLTTLSFVFFLFSAYALLHKKILLFSILYVISYWFDILDGHFARKYNMETTFGDYYDHVTDTLGLIIYIIIMVYLYKEKIDTKICVMTIIMFLLVCTHLGCQERWSLYGNHAESLSTLKILCPISKKKLPKVLNITKYFGCGSFVIYMVLITFYLDTK